MGAVAAVVSAAALVAVLVAIGHRGGEAEKPLLPPGQALKVDGAISPSVSLFGDTLTARVEVVLNRARIDPDDVQLKTAFAPYERVGPVNREREDVAGETRLSYSIPLRCDEFACLPATPTGPGGGEVPTRRAFSLQPARLSVRGTQIATQVRWKPIEVTSRVNETESGGIRYRATLSPPPAVSYRVRPGVVAAIAFALAAALALLGAVLLARAIRTLTRRRAPALDLPPVERALWLLRRTGDRDGERRRRALELLADALERERHDELAEAVRAVAWSHASPSPEDAESLADRVTTERRGNGRSRA